MITLHFACGHTQDYDPCTTSESAPICTQCGERRVRHVEAPKPTFTGVTHG